MNEKKDSPQDIKYNNKVIALGSSLFSAWYQYELMAKSKTVYTTRVKMGYMMGSGIICFFMTKFILDHYINKI